MSNFSDLLVDAAAATADQLGDDCVFVPQSGAEVPTKGILKRTTSVQGQLMGAADPRPSVSLLRAVVGRPTKGKVRFGDETFVLNGLLDTTGDGQDPDDGLWVRYYVQAVTP